MTVFFYALQAAPFALALLLGFLVPVMLVYLHNHFVFGLVLVVISFMVDTWTMGGVAIYLGFNAFSADLIFVLLAISTAIRFVFASDFPVKNSAWIFFVVAVMISILTGLASFGSAAGVQARSYFYFVIAGSYAMSFPMTTQRLNAIYKTLITCTLLLILIAIYRWLVYYLPIPSLLPARGTYNIDGAIRVIYSNHALVISQVMVIAFFFAIVSPGLAIMRLFSPVLLGMVIVLQHRSVWLAAMVGVLIRPLIGSSKSGSAFKQLMLVSTIAIITAIPLVFNDTLSGVTQQVSKSAAGALSGGGTGGERLQSWGEIVKNWYGAGIRSIAIGQSFGSDNTRTVVDSKGESRKIDYIAHNLYVQTLFNTGLFGLLSYGLANLSVLYGLYKICRTTRDDIHAEVLLVMLAMQAAYYVPYGVDYLQAFLFGSALAYVAGHPISKKQEHKKNHQGPEATA